MSRELLESSSKRVETLLDRFGAFPVSTGARADAEELVRIVSSLYGECLRRIVQTLRDEYGERGAALLERACGDPLTASLLIAQGLHPIELEERVRRALESVQPELERRKAQVRLMSIDEDVVALNVEGTAEVVPLLEQAIFAAAPEILEVRALGQTISLLSVT